MESDFVDVWLTGWVRSQSWTGCIRGRRKGEPGAGRRKAEEQKKDNRTEVHIIIPKLLESLFAAYREEITI